MPIYEVEIEERTLRTVRFEHEDAELGQDDISDIAAGLSESYVKANGTLVDASWVVNSGGLVDD